MDHPRKTIPRGPRECHLSLEHLSFLWVRFSKINDHKLSSINFIFFLKNFGATDYAAQRPQLAHHIAELWMVIG